MKFFKSIVWKILYALGIGAYVQLALAGYLYEKKWSRSFHAKRALDKDGKAIPWLSYPFLHFFEPRINNEMSAFEFGSGNSTLWFQDRVKTVTSVEHHKGWFNEMSAKVKANVSLVFQEDSIDGDYAKEVTKAGVKYDLILVDANDRFNCARYALQALKADGVIILDNAERPEYKPIYDLMSKEGFRNIEFEGMLGGTHVLDVTTVFYRTQNCLGI